MAFIFLLYAFLADRRGLTFGLADRPIKQLRMKPIQIRYGREPFHISYFWAFVAPTAGALPLIAFGWFSGTSIGPEILGIGFIAGDLMLSLGGGVAVLGMLGAGALGIPLHYLFRRRGITGLWPYLLGGMVIASLPMLVFLLVPYFAGMPDRLDTAFSGDSSGEWILRNLWLLMLLAIWSILMAAGAIAGSVFWWITKQRW